MMTKKGFKPGEVGSLPGAHFLTEAAHGHIHLTLLLPVQLGMRLGMRAGRPLHGLDAQQQ